jgi:hypothetical protein
VSVVLTGWYVGFAITIVVIAIVVICVASILALARRINTQAVAIENALEQARVQTLPLWAVGNVNDELNQIVRRAATGRSVLEGRR